VVAVATEAPSRYNPIVLSALAPRRPPTCCGAWRSVGYIDDAPPSRHRRPMAGPARQPQVAARITCGAAPLRTR